MLEKSKLKELNELIEGELKRRQNRVSLRSENETRSSTTSGTVLVF
ncbi:hypothetical protein RVIR1_04180 [Candidatus Rickettsiella viridis]|uniref:Uncharacterized protein n=1 Tax=Candidatus Rickettsiella viridis TaxID=676208 RepID=A0A2Z5UV89_9COXI|nr:hypothetical protein RVIR1_04180 [Candidatus Rickettsiella viridis]